MENMKVTELRSSAKQLGMKGYSKLRKDDLVYFIVSNLSLRVPQRPPAPAPKPPTLRPPEFKPYQLKSKTGKNAVPGDLLRGGPIEAPHSRGPQTRRSQRDPALQRVPQPPGSKASRGPGACAPPGGWALILRDSRVPGSKEAQTNEEKVGQVK